MTSQQCGSTTQNDVLLHNAHNQVTKSVTTSRTKTTKVELNHPNKPIDHRGQKMVINACLLFNGWGEWFNLLTSKICLHYPL